MKVTELSSGIWSVGMEDKYLRVFRSQSFTESGMRYNSYLLETDAGYMLLGSLPERYCGEWLAAIREKAGDKPVTHVVLFGVDSDLKAYAAIREAYPEVALVCGEKTLFDLVTSGGRSDKTVLVRSDKRLVFGGRELSFRNVTDKRGTPSLYVIDTKTGTLFTADTFGSDCALGATRVSELADKSAWLRGVALYYADIYGAKRAKVMAKAVALVRESGIKLICPAFGVIVDDGLEDLLALYERPAPQKGDKLKVAVVYSPENYISELAPEIAQGVGEAGDIEVAAVDLSAVSRDEALCAVRTADALLIGTPSADAKPVWDIITSLSADDCKGKLAAVFHTGGIDDPSGKNIRAHLALLGFDLNTNDSFTTGKPTEQDLKNAVDYGFGIGCLLQGIPNPRKPSLVKCLVCGEIFDASLGKCPVCGVGLDQCVPVDEDTAMFKCSTDRRYLIVGGGIAGLSAAEAIRRRDDTGEIIMLTQENYLPINRPMLTKDLAAIANDPDSLFVHNEDWYKERHITVYTGVAVTAIDTVGKTVATTAKYSLSYDKLIWAAGAECFVPPFKGKDKPGVITIRHLWDSAELEERIETGKKAVVIGGGVLGLEAASELMRAGIDTTVLEATPQIIGRQVDAGTAATLKGFMEGLKVKCYEGVTIEEITGEDKAEGVKLADGREFAADFVIVSCGNRANLGPMKDAGAAINRAIVVNSRMETSLPDIYACGDCCEFDGINYQLWQEASNQGRTAGANAAGEELYYRTELMGLSMEGFGTSLFAIGDPGKKEGVPYKTVEKTDNVRNKSEKYWFFGGSLTGAIVIGSPEKTGDVQTAVMTGARYEDLF